MVTSRTIFDYQQIVAANRKDFYKIYRKTLLPTKRCYDLIKEKGDYGFLLSIGYNQADETTLLNAATNALMCFRITETIFAPLFDVVCMELRENPLVFYDTSERINWFILPREELFKIILSYESEAQDSIIQRLTDNSVCFGKLHDAIKRHDFQKFNSTLDEFCIDTTAISQTLSFVHALLNRLDFDTFADAVDLSNDLYRASLGNMEILLPGNPKIIQGRTTRNNCVERFVWYHNSFISRFVQTFFLANRLLDSSTSIPPVLRQIWMVIKETEEYKEGKEAFSAMCPDLQEQLDSMKNCKETSAPCTTPKQYESLMLQPLSRRPTVFLGQVGLAKAERLYITLSNDGYVRTDEDNFFYLFRITTKRPAAGVTRIIWLKHKYELQALLHVLYPVRKYSNSEHPIKKSDMDKLFCDITGESFNLSNTPLQREKRKGSKIDAERSKIEERAIKQFKNMLKE